jgi:hypothetical protein
LSGDGTLHPFAQTGERGRFQKSNYRQGLEGREKAKKEEKREREEGTLEGKTAGPPKC